MILRSAKRSRFSFSGLLGIGLAVVTVAAWAGVVRGDAARWKFGDWKVRRIVGVNYEPTPYPGEDVGVAAFFTGGVSRADGKDFRVCTASGKALRFKVLQTGPGDFARIAFELVRGIKKYYIYYGNEKAEADEASKEWQPRRGVLLEVRKSTGGGGASVDALKANFEKSRTLLGADFVNNVFLGHNPFAPTPTPAVLHFTGYFVAPQAGMFDIATSSDDGSFLLIDGKQVVSWPGRHGRTWQARHTTKFKLSDRTVHRIDYWLITFGGELTAVAAWRLPGAAPRARYAALPQKVFLPIFRAQLLELDIRGKRIVPDFFAYNIGESWFDYKYVIRMKFKNISKGANPSYGSRALWEFGDGQKSTVWEPEHVYLTHGTYTVKLKVIRGPTKAEYSHRVYVNRDWNKQTQGKIDSIKIYAKRVAEYEFKTLTSANLIRAVELFARVGPAEKVVDACRALLFDEARKDVPEAEMHSKSLLLGDRLRAAGKYADAVHAYRNGEKKVRDPAKRADLVAHSGRVILDDLNDVAKAEAEFGRALKDYGGAARTRQMRAVLIGIGDTFRRRGNLSKSRENYALAAKIKIFTRRKEQNAVRLGTLARYVEEYTRTKEFYWTFHFLDAWGWEYPRQRIEGFWSLLRGRALIAKGDLKGAAVEALDCVNTNPMSPHAVELLMLAANCRIGLDKKPEAVKLLERIVKYYPEDPKRPQAIRWLKDLRNVPKGRKTTPLKNPKRGEGRPKPEFFGL
ncbi:MAG: PKD domain-containing protein [Planctomycetia bacterium]|nr:PKD domain-containing protein [Planctomycetia bacterium]